MSLNRTTAVLEDFDPNCNGLQPDECNTIRVIKKVIFSTTMVSDFVALIVLILFRKYKSFSQRIFLNILLSNLAEGVGHLINDGIPGKDCKFAAFLVQTPGFALFMWVSGLTVFLFLLIMKNFDSKGYERRYIIICWGIPLVLGMVPLFTDDYGPAGAYCWVIKSETGQYLRFVIWWIPVMVGVVLIFIAIVTMHCKTSRATHAVASEEFKRNQQKLVSNYLRPLTGYAASFVILHTIMFIDRLTTIQGEPIFPMRILQIICISSYGLILCTLFYLTNGVCSRAFSSEKLRLALSEYRGKYFPSAITRGTRVNFTSYNYQTTGDAYSPSTSQQVKVSAISDGKMSNPASSHKRVKFKPSFLESRNMKHVKRHKPQKSISDTSGLSINLDMSSVQLSVADSGIQSAKNHQSLSLSVKSNTVDLRLNEAIEEDSASESENVVKPEILLQPSEVLKGLVHKRYTLNNMNMLKVYLIDEDVEQWQPWDDGETIELFSGRIQKSTTSPASVRVCDQDGNDFGVDTKWSQIKAVASGIRIMINSGITAVTFHGEPEERDIELEAESGLDDTNIS